MLLELEECGALGEMLDQRVVTADDAALYQLALLGAEVIKV